MLWLVSLPWGSRCTANDPIPARLLPVYNERVRSWVENKGHAVEVPVIIEPDTGNGRAYAPLFPGFSGVVMTNISYSYDIT